MKKTINAMLVLLVIAGLGMTSCKKFENGGRISKAHKILVGKEGKTGWSTKLDRLYPTDDEDILAKMPVGTYDSIPGLDAYENKLYVPAWDIILFDGAELKLESLDKDKKRNTDVKAYDNNVVTWQVYALADPLDKFDYTANNYELVTLTGWWELSASNDAIELHLTREGGEEEWIYLSGGIAKLTKDAFDFSFDAVLVNGKTGNIGTQSIFISSEYFDW